MKKLAKVLSQLRHPFDRTRRINFRRHMLRPIVQFLPECAPEPLDCKNIPIFIVVFNHLSYLKKQAAFLESRGYNNIHIIDNCSDYPPLLEYLRGTSHAVHKMDKNWGHLALWKCGLFNDVIENQFYVMTDPDIMPTEQCPDDFLETLYVAMSKMPMVAKVGLALKIDDLPDSYDQKENVIEWESQYWKYPIANDMGLEMFAANIDTTFALYRPLCQLRDAGGIGKDCGEHSACPAARVAGAFSARHLPWYGCEDQAEQDYYLSTANSSASWGKKRNAASKNNKYKK